MKNSLHAIDKDWTLFLDRDGVINIRPDGDYVKNPEEFFFIEGVPEAIQYFNKIFKYIFVVTNQQGIAKGSMSVNDLDNIHRKMLSDLNNISAKIDDVFYCPDFANSNSLYRKPNIGMALLAKKKYPDINFKKSVMAGDALTDMLFGKKINMHTVYISNNVNDAKKFHRLIDYRFNSLLELKNKLEEILI